MSNTTGDSGPRFTEQQRMAVETRDVSVSLSAGAGCGKTFVLTERYLSYLDPRDPAALSPEQIGQLVAITFTDRAAREMRDRIRRRCYERLHSAPHEEAEYWSRLLRSLDNARISTIHAFCSALLRSRAVEAGLDPQFAVLEQDQADTLLTEAVSDELRRLISEHDERTLELAAEYGLGRLEEILHTLALQATPEVLDEWLASSPEELVARWQSLYLELKGKLADEFVHSREVVALRALLAEQMPTSPKMRERCGLVLAALDHLSALGPDRSLLALAEEIDKHARVQGFRATAWASPEIYAEARDGLGKVRESAKALARFGEFCQQGAWEAARYGLDVLRRATGVYQVYRARKQELRVLDFNDLLVRTRQLLVASNGVAQQFSERLTLLLVDEFQDTDPYQVELVRALCGDGVASGKLFFVGDHKQSIYRFRGADPHVFAELRGDTPEAGRQTLSQNFRSQPAILQFVNALFWDDLGDSYEPLVAHRQQVSACPAVEFLWAHNPTGGKESVGAQREREAEWIARRLRAVIQSREPIVWDAEAAKRGTPAARPARLGDIAILFRALTDVAVYEAALRKHQLDYYLVGGHAFYAQQEIFDLLNLLRTLQRPADLVSLAGVLRSPFFGLSDEALYWLGTDVRGLSASLFSETYPDAMSALDQQQAVFAARTLRELRDCKDRLPICELIERALELTGYDAMLLNEFLGTRQLANLVKLQEQARSFQAGGFLGLADFIEQLAQSVVKQPDEPLAATHSEDTDVIRLMSIHQSKGLEFPIVVVPDLSRRHYGGGAVAHLDAKFGPLVALPGDHEQADAVSGLKLWQAAEKFEDAAERNRLLYVATTRAADYLLLAAGVKSVGDDQSGWLELLARRFDLATGRFIGSLPPEMPRPLVRVTAEEPAAPPSSHERRARPDFAELKRKMERLAIPERAIRPAVDAVVPDPAARRQYSFSRLSGQLQRRYERLEGGAAGGVLSPDPRGLGTLVHEVLAALNPRRAESPRALVERIAEQHLPANPAEVELAVEMVERFVGSPRGRELASAQQVHAEVEFLLAWPPGKSPGGGVALRGYIDSLYQHAAGGWHVLDFKTNQLAGTSAARVAQDYEMQMLVYGLAVEQIVGVAPAELVLHFMRSGEEVRFDWHEQARQRVIELVERGIAAARAMPETLVAATAVD